MTPSAAAPGAPPGPRLAPTEPDPRLSGTGAAPAAWRSLGVGTWLAGGLVLAFLLLCLVLPVGRVFITAFLDADGSVTLAHFGAFFGQALMREAFLNSLYVALMSAVWASLIAVPLAYFTVRFEFRGALLIQTLGVLPLIMPPFVGAVALQLIFGRSGSINLLLQQHLGFTLPLMEGLNGVIFVEAIHYFPFILMNLTVALRNIDGAMEEAAQNLGCTGWRLFWRVIFPLSAPGFVAGASLVFVKVFDDLGTPLVMGQTNLLAPQAYLRITQVGLEDPLGYVISVIMIAFSILAMALSAQALKGRDYSTLQKGGGSLQRRRLSPASSVAAYAWIGFILLLTLSPHIGVLLLSLAKVWSFAPLPDAYTLEHYATVFRDSGGMIRNTLLYCGLAALLDVVIGVAVAYLILRTRLPARQWLDWIATASLAVPGIVLAIGYLRFYKGLTLPGTDILLTSTWVMIMLAYAVRRLPYALRSCVAALQQVHESLEEAAQSLGATRWRTIRRVVIPLMGGGILAGFVTSFITAAVELSATILLVSADSQAPMSYGIYLYMQSVAGRGPGAALGVLAIAVVAVGTWLSHRVVERTGGRWVPQPATQPSAPPSSDTATAAPRA
jgi:iron(III) transport system permease protein